MRDDDFFLPQHERARLEALLKADIPSLIEDLAVTACKQDRIGRTEENRHRRRKRLESSPPMSIEAFEKAEALHHSLVGAARLVCESRGRDYDGDSTTLGLCGWLAEYVSSIALTEGAEDVYFEIDTAVKAARRAVDHPMIRERYVGTCAKCDRDLYAMRSDTRYLCRCGTSVEKVVQDERINSVLEGQNYTAQELVHIVRDRLGLHVKVKTIYDLEYRKEGAVVVRGWRMIHSGRQVKMYRAGDVLAALRERLAA